MTRDHELGARLRELPVPEHAPGFFDAVRAELADAPAVLPPPRRRHWKRNTLRLATVAAAAIAVAAGVGIGPDGGPTSPRRATAAEVSAHVREAVAAVRTLRGELVMRDTGSPEVRYAFVTDDTGSFRLTGISRREDLAYDAATGVETGWSSDPAGAYAGERRGVALGYPDQGPADWVLQRHLSATVRALVAAGDASVRETTYDGQDAWELDSPVRANALSDTSGDRLRVSVDRRLGLPVRVVESRQGVFRSEVQLQGLVVDGPVSPSDFTTTPPPGTTLTTTDIGWRRVDLDAAARLAGYAPLVPATLPSGYRLAQVAYAAAAGPTGAEGSNPLTRRAVALQYRRGLDVLLVTTRLREAPGGVPVEDRHRCGITCLGGSAWTDPLASGEGFVDSPQQLTVDGGALHGAPAQLLVDPRVTPHVWVLGSELVVTISGDVSEAELRAALRSLTAAP